MAIRNRLKMRKQIRTNQRRQGQLYAARQIEEFGTFIDANKIAINNRTYPFRDTQGINPFRGQLLRVRNVGRSAAVLYAPSEGTS